MSTTTTHTPGPWSVTDSGDIAFSASAGFTPTTWGNDSPLSTADARLIAAAPELLDALNRCQDYLGGPWTAPEEIIDLARDIIARATGDVPQ